MSSLHKEGQPLITDNMAAISETNRVAAALVAGKKPHIDEALNLHDNMGIRVKHGAGAFESVYVYDDDSTEGYL